MEDGNKNLEEITETSPEPNEIVDKALDSVRKAVDYFEEQGITLDYVPGVEYSNQPCKLNPYILAAVDIDIESYKNLMGLIGSTFMKTTYERLFGLKLSEEALRESIDVAKAEIETIFPAGIYGDYIDIHLYSPIQSELHRLDELMAHEVWHLIEKEHGLLDGKGFIHEGTATYAQNRFVGREFEWAGSETDYAGVVYENTAYLVHEEVKNEPDPLKALLDTEKRKNIQLKFDEKILPLAYEKAVDLIEAGATNDFSKELLFNHPAYEAFRKKPNADNLLFALRQREYVKLADDISKQDMTKLVKYYKELIS
ncbi:MAG: hypothetical protein ACOCQG_05625 [Candidatus Nanoarchaeia archaeon]